MSTSERSTIRRAPTARPAFTGFRRYGRADVETEIIIQDSEGWEIPLECVNLSPTGMFVHSQFLFDVGEEHVLIFREPRDQQWIRIAARVVRVEQGIDELADSDAVPGMAYEFTQTDEQTWERLCELVAHTP